MLLDYASPPDRSFHKSFAVVNPTQMDSFVKSKLYVEKPDSVFVKPGKKGKWSHQSISPRESPDISFARSATMNSTLRRQTIKDVVGTAK